MIIALAAVVTAGTTSYTVATHPESVPLFITVLLASANGVWIGSILVTRPAHRTKTTRRHRKTVAVRTTRHGRTGARTAEPQVETTPEQQDYAAELLAARIPQTAAIAWQDAIALEEALRIYSKDDPPPPEEVIWSPEEEPAPIG